MRKPFDDIFLQDVFSLPTRDGGDPGGALERTMLARAGGAAGVVRVEEVDIDGTVTRLYTRGGFPVFETERRSVSSTPVLLRGFVARAVPGGRAVLFNPYTLAVLNANYSPAKNTYAVQDFATAWNVPAGDTTDWYDVVLFDGSTVKVNAKAMPALGITANHAFAAIPYCINRNDTSDQYGNAERNQTEKRVFAVGRADVKAWGGSSATETLTPTDPRTEDRGLTIGQRVDYATDKAWLGQLYYPATGWDGTGEWYFTGASITMLLTAPYLSKVASNANVAMSPATMSDDGTTAGNRNTTRQLPITPVGLTADGTILNAADVPSQTIVRGDHIYTGTRDLQMSGYDKESYSRDTYSGSAADSVVQSGMNLDYSADNMKWWEGVSAETWVDDQNLDMIGYAPVSGTTDEISTTGTALYWASHNEGLITAYRGNRYASVIEHKIFDTERDVEREHQEVACSIDAGGVSIVSVSLVQTIVTGPQISFSPNTSYYTLYVGGVTDPGFGMGTGSGGYYGARFTNYHKNPSGYWSDMTPAVKAEINAALDDMAAEYMAQTFVTSEKASGIYREALQATGYYFASLSSVVRLVSASATWSTKDFILHDATNGVFISIDATFSGIDTAATLTVTLTVQTRHHTNTITLAQRNYTYTELLPESEIGTTGKYAVPSPQIRAIFAPLYQEQGSFKGAHYVTQDEEGNGATPFHGFDFLLYLRSYGDIGTLNAENETGAAVYFVPCNLLEMLYAIVFSQEFGVGTTRYPVTYTARFNDLMGTLFADPVRVSIRDGVSSLWTNAFGADFAATSTISLHRA